MSVNHPVSDIATRIRNGYLAYKNTISSPSSKLRQSVLDALKNEGFIAGYAKTKLDNGLEDLEISLKYFNQKPVIEKIEVISKPGRRVYKSCSDIPVVNNGLGVVLVSTSKGVLTDHQAREGNLGGEILLKIF